MTEAQISQALNILTILVVAISGYLTYLTHERAAQVARQIDDLHKKVDAVIKTSPPI